MHILKMYILKKNIPKQVEMFWKWNVLEKFFFFSSGRTNHILSVSYISLKFTKFKSSLNKNVVLYGVIFAKTVQTEK